MKRIIIIFAILVIIIPAAFFLVRLRFLTPSFNDLNQQMQYLVSDLVKKDKSVRNCVLSVTKGDGSFSWSGAAGIASQNGEVPMTKDTPTYIASIAKLYTATATMLLYEKGKLSLDAMSKYLPEKLIRGIHVYEGRDYSSEITIKQLLSHTSGIADYYTEKPEGGETLFEMFLEDPERSWTEDEMIERVRNDLKPNFKPDTDASYSDTNFQLLVKVIEAITGKPLHIIYEDFIFRPLGLKHTWLTGISTPQMSPSSHPADIFYKDMNITRIRSNGAYWGDVVSTAEEMTIFLKALNEGKIISRDTVILMHNWNKLQQFPLQYGYGTMYFKLPWFIDVLMKVPPLWGHSGSTGSFLYYCEDLNLYMAGTINQGESNSKPFRLMIKVMRAFQTKR
jgi:CubicO group peptidase (beta-lactamase class C family)